MSRTLGAIADELANASLNPFFALELMFDEEVIIYNGQAVQSGPLYLWTGYGDLTYGGITYTGGGNCLDVSQVAETSEVRATGMNVTLSGLDFAVMGLAISQPYQGRICNVKFGLLDDSGAVIALMSMFTGYMDQMNIAEGSDACIIQLSIESKLIDLERARVFRYTSENQKAKFPNDLAFDFIPNLQDQTLSWGRN